MASSALKYITTDKAPAAIGPYSQAVVANGMVFVSGQIPIDPATKEVLQGNIEQQTTLVLKNLRAVLQAAGSDFDKVMKTTIFLKDMNDFATVNKIYGEHFGASRPARATVQVARLPRDVAVEIEAIGLVG